MHGPTFCLSSDAVFEQVFVLMDQMRFLTDPGRLRGDYNQEDATCAETIIHQSPI